MKRVLALVCVLLCASAIYAASVEPQTINGIALVRGASSVVVTTNAVFIQGDPLLITNLTLYADTAGVVAQDLTDLSVQVGIGNATTATWYNASAIIATNGTCAALLTVPALDPAYWQVRLNTNAVHYERQVVRTVPHL